MEPDPEDAVNSNGGAPEETAWDMSFPPAVKDAAEALAIHGNFLENNRPRLNQLASIAACADGIYGPYSVARLREAGAAWFSNFNTHFLPNILNIIAPRLVLRIKQAPFITASVLPDEYPDGYAKSVIFQTAITRLWRSWLGNDVFTRGLAHEVALYGKAIVAYPDKWALFPKIYRTDKAFVPEGVEVGQLDCGVCSIEDYYLPHQLRDQIFDRAAAADAGWNIDNCLKAIQEAAPIPATATNTPYTARSYEDLVREATPGYSYVKGNKVIAFINQYATERDGSVTQRIIRFTDGLPLFYAHHKEMTMPDFVQTFTFQYGNGKFYGSYGAGQMLYDLSNQIERLRNRVVDNFWNRGRIIGQIEEPADMDKMRQVILDNYIFIAGAQLAGNSAAYPSLVDDFERLDAYLSKIAQNNIGAFLPETQDPSARPLAVQAKINQLKEDERSIFTTEMWLNQWARMIWMVQRRACNPDSTVDEAVECRKYLVEKMGEEALVEIVEKPPYQTILAEPQADNEKRVAYLMDIKKTNDQHYNQQEVRRQLDTTVLGPGGGNGLLLNQADNAVVIAASREQQTEVYLMSNGQRINAAPQDNHIVHMGYLRGQPNPQKNGELTGPLPQAIYTANAALQQNDVQAATQIAQLASLYYMHYVEHFTYAAEAKQLGEGENEQKQFISQIGKMLQTIKDAIQELTTSKEGQAA